MTGPADLPEGQGPGLTASPSVEGQAGDDEFAPSGKRWADMTVEDILAEVGALEQPAPAPAHLDATDWQQFFGAKLMAAAQATGGVSGPRTFTVDDTGEFVADVVRQGTGREIGARPVWVRFVREAEGKGALFVLSSPHPLAGADMIAVAHRGMITRGLLRDVAIWAFCAVQLNRLTIRIPNAAKQLQDLARRCGFVFEGRNSDLYGPGIHGQTWAMTPAGCPWLPHRARPAPQISAISFPSLKVH